MIKLSSNIPKRRRTEMSKRQTMIFGVVAVLLIGSLIGSGCGSTPVPPTSTPEPPKKLLFADSLRLAEVCAGDDAGVPEAAPYTQTPGIHPVLNANERYNGWKPSADYKSQWEPQQLAEAELVACVEQRGETVEKCSYTLTSGEAASVSRIQKIAVVTLREAQTGKVIATSPDIEGSLPAKCKESEQFKDGKKSKSLEGGKPANEVNDWLKQYVEIP
jgi:hypothetical protein